MRNIFSRRCIACMSAAQILLSVEKELVPVSNYIKVIINILTLKNKNKIIKVYNKKSN